LGNRGYSYYAHTLGNTLFEIASKKTQLSDLDRAVAVLANTQNLAIARAREIEGLSERLDHTDAALAEAQKLVIERYEEIQSLSERLNHTETEQNTIYSSRSWRITKPLRMVNTVLRKWR
jgi:hypothetical protein